MNSYFRQLLAAGLGAGLAFAQEAPQPKPPTPPSAPDSSSGQFAPPPPPPDRPQRGVPPGERGEPGLGRPDGGRPGPRAGEPGLGRPDGDRPGPRAGEPGLGRPDGDRPLPPRNGGGGIRPEFDRPPRPPGPNADRPPRPDEEGQLLPGISPPDNRYAPRGDGPPMGRPPEKLQPYLGVITRPMPPEFSAQLKQPEGFGLILDDLLPESPAQTAGLQRNDLLLRFEDQWLVNPPQLEALVRRAGKDHEVALTILRAGAEQKVTVKIGEKLLPERRPIPGMSPGNFSRDFGPGGEDGRPRGEGREFGPRGEGNGGGNAGGGDRQIRYAPNRARIVRQDDRGTYELSLQNGEATFIVKKADGTIAWQGVVQTPEQRKAVPAEWEQKLSALEAARTGPRFPRDDAPREGQPREGFRPGPPGQGQGWAPRPGATDPVER